MTEQVLEKLGQLAHSAVHRIHVRSALNPLLWLCAIVTPIFLFAAYQFRDIPTFSWVLLVAAVFPIVVSCASFVGFAIFKPEKLQSEDYQLRHETLQIIQQKSGQVALDPTSLQAIANPEQKRLQEGGKQS